MKSYKETQYAVEATRFEELCLWRNNSDHWKQHNGILETVGFIGEYPVCISLMWATINNEEVVFWYPTSIKVCHNLIEAWFKENMPHVRRSDAMNFRPAEMA